MLTVISEKRVDTRLLDLAKDVLAGASIDSRLVFYEGGEDEIGRALARSEAVLCFPGRWLSTDLIRLNSHIRLYQLWSSGLDKFNTAACRESGIKVNNNSGMNAQSVAEHTLMLMLGCSRKLVEMTARARTGMWYGNCQGAEMHTLYGKTLFILGGGNIGSRVAKLALAFGMHVNVCDPKRRKELENLGITYVSKEDGLRNADIVTLHLHYGQETHNIIKARDVDNMKDGAILINVSRSQLIACDCIEPIKRKRVRLGIDVYDKEPTTGDEMYFTVKQSLFTPHTAGSTIDAIKGCIEYCVENAWRAMNDEVFDYVQ